MFVGRDVACVRGGRMVLAGIDFRLERGEALVVAGPNGSGKSTLLRLMAGLLLATSGEIIWNGASIDEDPEAFHQDLHYCGHLDGIKLGLTVAENLAFWIGLRGGDASGLLPALEAFGLAELRDLPARLLSAGQRRRLGLARLSAVPAPLWLLDEPTIALDAASVANLLDRIGAHLADGGIAVVATNVPLEVPRAKELHINLPGAEEAEEALWP